MSYTAPTITPSSATFSDLRDGGHAAILGAVLAANAAPTAAALSMVNAGSTNGSDLVRIRLVDLTSQYISGAPVDHDDIVPDLSDLAWVAAIHAQVANEIATLIDANPGTLGWSPTQVQNRQVRTWS